ncbi:hypothetical protein CFK37_12160 [Virgibacillus phasianinus]|uniref:TadE-like domain-containing protein n=1 Tax=Virgibacillus phasianinus TaxID=2017483 RepID=A0A220U411_9BACI|nr:TadE family protein [Virgibacillus phasianinus]ASK62847.1 hypothetical protein CFK37_12160 [Virgibacillus phasianinus]
MKSFCKDDRGSFTIEASFVFPSLLLFTLLGVFFCIIIFQIGTANYVAQKAAAQTAYVWDNSNKDLETGEFAKKYYAGLDTGGDGLYWRITDNGILGIFGISGGLFPGKSLSGEKIENAEAAYNGSISVELTYNNKLVYSEVEAEASSSLYIPAFVTKLLGSNVVKAKSTHVVTETPELIRTFNFAKYMWTRFGAGGPASGLSIGSFFGGAK